MARRRVRSATDPQPPELHVSLDCPLPAELASGAGTALFVGGWCVCPGRRIRSLSLVLDGASQALAQQGMPRLDVLRALQPGADPFASDTPANGYRSGFWGYLQLGPATSGHVWQLALRAELEDGAAAVAPLAAIRSADAPQPVAAEAEVAICMATYEPPPELLRRQLDSIRAQSHENWVCLISDDCSSPASYAELERAVGDDPRFVLSRAPTRLGFYHNFERALGMAPAQAAWVAMADQDDEWHPDKLAVLLSEIGSAKLIYSDARIVARDGSLLADTYWSTRRNNHSDLLSLLVANSVTGAASLFPRALLDDALPFPPAQFAHFHDHWIALCALALGEIAYVDRPLYDYVQHGDASLGHAAANQMPTLAGRLGSLRRDPHERVRMWRMHYFVDVCRLMQFALVLRTRCGQRMAPAKRRALQRFLAVDRSPAALVRLGARGARELLSRRPETLGAEWMLLHALVWRRLLGASARARPSRRLRLDALPPATLAPKPGRRGLEDPQLQSIAAKVAPLVLAASDAAPRRVNLLIPTIDLEHLFGGYIAKFNLARRLAELGMRVRIVTVDPCAPLPPDWQAQLASYSGLGGLFERVEVAFGREGGALEVSREDRFVATTWWSAHIADAAVRELGGAAPFLYLIQEYEPFTFPMGTYAALAAQSYEFSHRALFSTELLREYFRRHGLGVFAAGERAGEAASASFQNAITPVEPPAAGELSARRSRRLLFYARPEPHAARNMFELGVLALSRALEEGAFRGADWEFHGIGSLTAGRRLELGSGAVLELLARSEQSSYAEVLREHDIGLALMLTPHPSLVPIEMASAGLLTVTNSFENKTAAALSAISPNLITTRATIAGVAAGLAEAARGVDDFERRADGSRVQWSSDWQRSLDEPLMRRIAELLG
ncbi:MAG: hypothetical protein NVSMB51_19520 [Solirubrobacteraceae bacterium]